MKTTEKKVIRIRINDDETWRFVPVIDSKLRLSSYLREYHSSGSKLRVCCEEGGCGSCTVLFRQNSKTFDSGWKAIHSCLRLLISCNDSHIITTSTVFTESLARSLADGNGVQCGFCSPGILMSTLSHLLHQKNNNDQESLYNYLDGHLCRCTGYRPILTSLSSKKTQEMALRDIEDTPISFLPASPSSTPQSDASSEPSSCVSCHHRYTCHPFIGSQYENWHDSSFNLTTPSSSKNSIFYCPSTIDEILSIYHDEISAHYSHSTLSNQNTKNKVIRFIAANTSSGLEKYFKQTNTIHEDKIVLIDLNQVTELKSYNLLPMTKHLVVHAMVTIDELSKILRTYASSNLSWIEASNHLQCIGNKQIRTIATWGGNILMALRYPKQFTSDLLLILFGLQNVRISVIEFSSSHYPTATNRKEYDLESFYHTFSSRKNDTRNIDFLIHSISIENDCFKNQNKNNEIPKLSKVNENFYNDPSTSHNSVQSNDAMDTKVELVSKAYRVSPRSSNSYAYAALFVVAQLQKNNLSEKIEKQNGTEIIRITNVKIVMNGISSQTVRAKNCELAMMCHHGDITLLWHQALSAIKQDILQLQKNSQGDNPSSHSSSQYQSSVIIALLYKFFLLLKKHSSAQTDNKHYALEPCRNASNACPSPDQWVDRKNHYLINSSYTFSTNESTYPITYPISKIDAYALAIGRAKYVIDYELPRNGLYGSLIIARRACVVFKSLENHVLPGVVGIITADDIPNDRNYLRGNIDEDAKDKNEALFVKFGEIIPYVGACLGVIVAKSEHDALEASKKIEISYEKTSNLRSSGVYSLEEAISTQSTFENCTIPPIERGNTCKALKNAPMRLRGRIHTGGQKHFYLENQNSVATPTGEGSFIVHSATQAVSDTQKVVANVLGIPLHKVNIVMKRTGGAFGGKFTRSFHCAAAAAVAAAKFNLPVHVKNDREIDFAMVGGREPAIYEYDVGFDENARISALFIKIHMDSGYFIDFSRDDLELAMSSCDHCYSIPNFSVEGTLYKTNLPVNTACRAPGSVQSCYVIDAIISKVARVCDVPMYQCQKLNFYQEGQCVLIGDTLNGCNLQKVWDTLWGKADLMKKLNDIDVFNSRNKWKKRGLGITPCKYGVLGSWFKEIAKVGIFASDGSVEVTHSGVEMGQGIDTKVVQCVALSLGVPMNRIIVGEKSSNSQPNTFGTAASATSEVCCSAALKACEKLNDRLKPYKETLTSKAKETSKGEIDEYHIFCNAVKAANQDRVCLSAEGWSAPQVREKYQYYVYCAAAVEVEVDILTGQMKILSNDIVYDCGNQLNASIDIGQIEGGVLMGFGYFLSEDVIHDKTNGELLTKNTWQYKPPSITDIPIKSHVHLLRNSPNNVHGAVLRSKATGEPPLICSSAVAFATHQAIYSFWNDTGYTGIDMDFNIPLTVEKRHKLCKISDHLKI